MRRAERLGIALKQGRFEPHQRDPGTSSGELGRRCCADPSRRSGDQDVLADETALHAHRPTFSVCERYRDAGGRSRPPPEREPLKDLVLVAALVIVALALIFAARYFFRGSKKLGTAAQRTTYTTLHTASIAARGLRSGLTADSAARS